MDDRSQRNLHVTYLLLAYPKLTITFVDREIMILRNLGVNVQICALEKRDGLLSGYQQALKNEVMYLFPASPWAKVKAHLRWLLHRPVRYLSTLIYLLTREHPTFPSHWRTLRHFNQGIYAADRLREQRTDHLHAHFLNQSATIALIASRMLDIPYSVTAHASGELFINPMMLREKMSQAKFVATCTRYNQEYIGVSQGEEIKRKVRVIYHGLDANLYRRRQMPNTARPMILSVGQLRERKGYRYLVEACGLLKQRGLDFECRIIGEGPERAPLESLIERLGLHNHVRLCGAMPQEEVIREYERASIFTLPAVLSKDGDRDGIPNVVLEAMSMEVPVVSTWHSGLPEVIEDGRNGLLVAPEDTEALARALSWLLNHPEQRVQLGHAGRETVQEKFDPERNARQLLTAFTS